MNLVSSTMTESKSFNKGIYTVFLSAFLVLFQIGIYFVYIPWNAERLQITEAEIVRTNSSGLAIYNPKLASEHLKSMKNKSVSREDKILARQEYERKQAIN